MNKVWFSAVAALAFAGAGAAFAADTQDYRPSAGEFDDFGHGYSLNTGERVRFTQKGKQRFFAQVDGRKPERMYAMSKGVFMTESGARVEFSEWGDAVTVKNFELMSPPLAAR